MNIKQQRTESLLHEIINEAISQLADSNINALSITAVNCSKGKQSAEVYIEGTGIAQDERTKILKQLHKAQNTLQNHIITATQWFRAPNLHFKFDDSLSQVNKLDKIFAHLENERKSTKEV